MSNRETDKFEVAKPDGQEQFASEEQLAQQLTANIAEFNTDRRKKTKRRRRHVNPFVVLAIIIACIAGILVFLNSSFFDVQEFTVEGNSYYLDEEILTMGKCQTGGNIFWGTDLKGIKSRLEKDSYMSEVKVSRKLPHTVKIKLTERKQVAAIVYGDRYVVIDASGYILRKTDVEPKLTIISGLTISKLEVGSDIEVEETVRFGQALEIITSMEKNNMYFTKLVVSKDGITAYVLDNLICSGSPDALTECLESGKLAVVVQELFDREIERGTIKISGSDNISFSPKID